VVLRFPISPRRTVSGVPKKQIPGIFCLEGEWSPKLTDPSTVRPILELLATQRLIKFIQKDVGTIEELRYFLNKWLQKQYADYSVGYLAFHGEPGALWLRRGHRVDLETLAEIINGRGAGRILYFGSCSTLDLEEKNASDLQDFLRETKLKAVCGYSADVNWLESAAFEVLLVEALTYYRRVDAMDNYLRHNYPNLCDRLEFRMVWLKGSR